MGPLILDTICSGGTSSIVVVEVVVVVIVIVVVVVEVEVVVVVCVCVCKHEHVTMCVSNFFMALAENFGDFLAYCIYKRFESSTSFLQALPVTKK